MFGQKFAVNQNRHSRWPRDLFRLAVLYSSSWIIRDVKGTGFFGTGGTGTAKLFFFCGMGRDWDFRDSGTDKKRDKSGQNGIPWFLFYLIKKYYPPEPEARKSKPKLVTRNRISKIFTFRFRLSISTFDFDYLKKIIGKKNFFCAGRDGTGTQIEKINGTGQDMSHPFYIPVNNIHSKGNPYS